MKRSKGCRCASKQALHSSDYMALADRLGIQWIGTHVPVNSKTLTRWRNPAGVEFDLPYRTLYGRIPTLYRSLVSTSDN